MDLLLTFKIHKYEYLHRNHLFTYPGFRSTFDFSFEDALAYPFGSFSSLLNKQVH